MSKNSNSAVHRREFLRWGGVASVGGLGASNLGRATADEEDDDDGDDYDGVDDRGDPIDPDEAESDGRVTTSSLETNPSPPPDGTIRSSSFDWSSQGAPSLDTEYGLRIADDGGADLNYRFRADRSLTIDFHWRYHSGSRLAYMFNDQDSLSQGFRAFTNGIAYSGLYFRNVFGGSDISASGNYQDGSWYHIRIVLDGAANTYTVYVDGDRIGQSYYDGTGWMSRDRFRIMGRRSGSSTRIDYDRYVITDRAVHPGDGPVDSDLLHYRLDDGAGTSLRNGTVASVEDRIAQQFAPNIHFDADEKWYPTDPRNYTVSDGKGTTTSGFKALNEYTAEYEPGDPPDPALFYSVKGIDGDDDPLLEQDLIAVTYWRYYAFDQFTVNFHWHDSEKYHVFIDSTAVDDGDELDELRAVLYAADPHASNGTNSEYLDENDAVPDSIDILSELGSHGTALAPNERGETFERFASDNDVYDGNPLEDGEWAYADVTNPGSVMEIRTANTSYDPLNPGIVTHSWYTYVDAKAYGLPRDETNYQGRILGKEGLIKGFGLVDLGFRTPYLDGQPIWEDDRVDIDADDLVTDPGLERNSHDQIVYVPPNASGTDARAVPYTLDRMSDVEEAIDTFNDHDEALQEEYRLSDTVYNPSLQYRPGAVETLVDQLEATVTRTPPGYPTPHSVLLDWLEGELQDEVDELTGTRSIADPWKSDWWSDPTVVINHGDHKQYLNDEYGLDLEIDEGLVEGGISTVTEFFPGREDVRELPDLASQQWSEYVAPLYEPHAEEAYDRAAELERTVRNLPGDVRDELEDEIDSVWEAGESYYGTVETGVNNFRDDPSDVVDRAEEEGEELKEELEDMADAASSIFTSANAADHQADTEDLQSAAEELHDAVDAFVENALDPVEEAWNTLDAVGTDVRVNLGARDAPVVMLMSESDIRFFPASQGRITAHDVPPGAYTLVATAPGCAPHVEPVDVTEDGVTEIGVEGSVRLVDEEVAVPLRIEGDSGVETQQTSSDANIEHISVIDDQAGALYHGAPNGENAFGTYVPRGGRFTVEVTDEDGATAAYRVDPDDEDEIVLEFEGTGKVPMTEHLIEELEDTIDAYDALTADNEPGGGGRGNGNNGGRANGESAANGIGGRAQLSAALASAERALDHAADGHAHRADNQLTTVQNQLDAAESHVDAQEGERFTASDATVLLLRIERNQEVARQAEENERNASSASN